MCFTSLKFSPALFAVANPSPRNPPVGRLTALSFPFYIQFMYKSSHQRPNTCLHRGPQGCFGTIFNINAKIKQWYGVLWTIGNLSFYSTRCPPQIPLLVKREHHPHITVILSPLLTSWLCPWQNVMGENDLLSFHASTVWNTDCTVVENI